MKTEKNRNSFSGSIGRKRRRIGEYLAVPIPGSQRWRRAVPGGLPSAAPYLWLHFAYHRNCNRAQDKTKPPDGLQKAPGKMGVSGDPGMPGAHYYHALLLCHWRMGNQVLHHIFYWRRQQRSR